MAGAAERIRFDFEGSLQLARELWSLADDLRTESMSREGDARLALERWSGPHADSFAERNSNEMSSRLQVVADLRQDARNWARAWQTALDQQNKINRINKVEQIRQDRGFWEKGWQDYGFGTDDSETKVPQPPDVEVPTPPHFEPTATESFL